MLLPRMTATTAFCVSSCQQVRAFQERRIRLWLCWLPAKVEIWRGEAQVIGTVSGKGPMTEHRRASTFLSGHILHSRQAWVCRVLVRTLP